MNPYIKTVIEKYYKNKKNLFRLKDNTSRCIMEMAGMVLYDSTDVIQKARELTEEIIDFYKNPDNRDIVDTVIFTEYENPVYNLNGDNRMITPIKTKFFGYNFNLPLLKNLFVMVTFNSKYSNSFL